METPALVLVTGLPGAGKSMLANRLGALLAAPVFGHDWTMAGLVPFPAIQDAIAEMDWVTSRSVGWSVMWSLARAQLRAGRSVVLDGVARDPEVEGTRGLADEEGARSLVVLVECPDLVEHRNRIVGRSRGIPGWHELSWEDVARSVEGWKVGAPSDVDLRADSTDDLEDAVGRIVASLARG